MGGWRSLKGDLRPEKAAQPCRFQFDTWVVTSAHRPLPAQPRDRLRRCAAPRPPRSWGARQRSPSDTNDLGDAHQPPHALSPPATGNQTASAPALGPTYPSETKCNEGEDTPIFLVAGARSLASPHPPMRLSPRRHRSVAPAHPRARPRPRSRLRRHQPKGNIYSQPIAPA